MILKDVSPDDVDALLSFVYQGVVYVSEKKLCSFLQTAELLQIKGLAGAASTLSDEQAKAAIAAGTGGGQQSPVKRRKSAPVRIVKQEDGSEDSSTNQMDNDDDAIRSNEYSEEMNVDMKNVSGWCLQELFRLSIERRTLHVIGTILHRSKRNILH